MLSLFQKLFGGSEQKSTSTPTDLTPSEFSGLRPEFANFLRGFLQEGGPQYEGPLNAEMTQGEQDVLGQLRATTGPGTQRSQYLGEVLGGRYLPGQDRSNPFLDATIRAAQRPTLEGLQQTLERSLPGRFALAGQTSAPRGSSAFDRAAATASTGAANALSDIATNISFGAYEQERGRQQQAVQLDQVEVDATVKNLQAQGLPRLIQELGIERGMQLFQQRTQGILEVLRLLGGVTSPVIAQTQQSTGESTGGVLPAISKFFPKGLSLPK